MIFIYLMQILISIVGLLELKSWGCSLIVKIQNILAILLCFDNFTA